jgi:hypothetical protein
MTSVAYEAVPYVWDPARDFHHGPETAGVSLDEAEDTSAVSPLSHSDLSALAEGVQIR